MRLLEAAFSEKLTPLVKMVGGVFDWRNAHIVNITPTPTFDS